MIFNGIQFTKEELKSFQEFAPDSPGAMLLQRILLSVEAEALEELENTSANDVRIRQAQGIYYAIKKIGALANKFANHVVEEFDDIAGDEEDELIEEDIDVRF